MTETVAVIGAGMAGLWTALALAPTGRKVTLLDRDPPPPPGDADEAFTGWAHRGVTHLRHSHAFLARLRGIIRDEHPALLEALNAAGCRELGLDGMLTERHRKRWRPRPEDADLVVLTSRRTTMELVIRRYVEAMPNVEIRSEAFVEGLDASGEAPLKVTGVRLRGGETVAADLVVDASGRTSSAFDQLADLGVQIGEAAEDAGILYFTRHYRLRPGQVEPPRGGAPATGDLGFIKFGVFPADNGCFSITLCVPEIELEIRKTIVDPAIFDGICREIPGMRPWLEPERTEAVSKVYGMGDLKSRWRTLVSEGRAAVLGFFAVGDSLIRTNPLYGRGCAFAAVSATLLRDALEAGRDPAGRLFAYEAGLKREILPFFETMQKDDRAAVRRARQALDPHHRPSLRSRILKSFAEDGVAIAIRSDPDLLRSAMRGFHMLEHPSDWLKRPVNLGKVLLHWMTPRAAKAEVYPPKAGPRRAELMRAVGLDPELDIARVSAG
ncbi:FAD-dependent oxidoreductase [Phenylobacterium sp.]|uniref:FAD-dependent oxidoreductase n=1 Tax=Phenylobacterium sp. TaxID=1871053 RepID=UPI002FDEA09C